MADLELHNGKVVKIDAYAISHSEYNQVIAGSLSDEEENEIFAKVCGLTLEEVNELPERDWRRLVLKVLEAITNPNLD
jgi:predicted sugar kinase